MAVQRGVGPKFLASFIKDCRIISLCTKISRRIIFESASHQTCSRPSKAPWEELTRNKAVTVILTRERKISPLLVLLRHADAARAKPQPDIFFLRAAAKIRYSAHSTVNEVFRIVLRSSLPERPRLPGAALCFSFLYMREWYAACILFIFQVHFLSEYAFSHVAAIQGMVIVWCFFTFFLDLQRNVQKNWQHSKLNRFEYESLYDRNSCGFVRRLWLSDDTWRKIV